MNRKEILENPGYWTQDIQLDIYDAVNNYLETQGMTRKDFAKKLGVTKGYISQILNGNFDHKLSKLVELILACELVPVLTLIPMERAESATTVRCFNKAESHRYSYDGTVAVHNICQSGTGNFEHALETFNYVA